VPAQSYFTNLEFDLPKALLNELTRRFDELVSGQLNDSNLTKVPEAQGVYQLFLDDQLVYVGKTDAEAGLNKRLLRHCNKIQHRKDLPSNRVSFKAVRI
jgi:hypothetical protein